MVVGLPMTLTDYATLRAAAQQSQAAFDAAVAGSVWDGFFKTYPGIHKAAARQGVIDLLP